MINSMNEILLQLKYSTSFHSQGPISGHYINKKSRNLRWPEGDSLSWSKLNAEE